MYELRWRKRNGAILPGGSVKAGKEVVLGSDRFIVRPNSFTIYRRPGGVARQFREQNGESPNIPLDQLPAESDGGRSARSEPWTLPTPGRRIKWQLFFEDDQLHRSTTLHVSRLGTIKPRPGIKAPIPHTPVLGSFDIEFEFVAAIDPVVELFVMTPWGEGNESLDGFLDELASDATGGRELDTGRDNTFRKYIEPHLPREPLPGWDFRLARSRLELAEGERAEVTLQLRAPTAGSTAFAIQMISIDAPEELATASDLFIVEVPDDGSEASMLFADDDDDGEGGFHGSLGELRDWGQAMIRRLASR